MNLDTDWDEYQKRVMRTITRRLFFGEKIPLEQEYRDEGISPFAIDAFDITAVEILVLGSCWGSQTTIRGNHKILKTTRFTGTDALDIASTWSQLIRTDHSFRCHSPTYGVRFYTSKGSLFEATICWHCRNVIVESPEHGATSAGFLPYSRAGKKLLAYCVKSMWIRSSKST